MEIIAVIVWVIVILGVAWLCFYLSNWAPDPFRKPIRIFIVVIAAILLVYLLGGLLMKIVPPFPGLMLPALL